MGWFSTGAHKYGARVCFPGEGILLLMASILLMLVIAFLPTTGRYLFALFTVLFSAGLFYAIFLLWHWAPSDDGLYAHVAAHW